MKAIFTAFVAVFLLGTSVQASEQNTENLNAVPNGIWHCTAYPQGGGHHHGHDAYDVHYSHAYWAAKHDCEHYHHYCHVHCHYDWH